MHYLVFRRPSSPSSVSPNNIIFIVGGYVHFAPFLFHFSSQQQYSSLKCLVWSVEYHWCTSGVCIHWGITQYINYRTLHCSLCDGIKTLTFHCRTPLFSEGMYVSLFRVFFLCACDASCVQSRASWYGFTFYQTARQVGLISLRPVLPFSLIEGDASCLKALTSFALGTARYVQARGTDAPRFSFLLLSWFNDHWCHCHYCILFKK